MNPWVESLGVLMLAAGGVWLGAWFSRLSGSRWLLGYFLPFTVVAGYAVAAHLPGLTFVPPVSWLMLGRTKFAISGFVGAMVLTTPLMKLPKRRDRVAVSALMTCLVLATSVWPFLAPAFNQKFLAGLKTFVDGNGVCRQNTDYTCGPAAAVTALRRLGFAAEEGELALLAHTSSATGTEPDILAQILRKKYGPDGLVCEYRAFKDVGELKRAGLTLAVIKFALFVDHYVTVLEVRDDGIVVGDPLGGLTTMPVAEFCEKWRFVGVVLARK
jgi:MFS family permease